MNRTKAGKIYFPTNSHSEFEKFEIEELQTHLYFSNTHTPRPDQPLKLRHRAHEADGSRDLIPMTSY